MKKPPGKCEVLSVRLHVHTAPCPGNVIVGFETDCRVIVTLSKGEYGGQVVFAAEEIELYASEKCEQGQRVEKRQRASDSWSIY